MSRSATRALVLAPYVAVALLATAGGHALAGEPAHPETEAVSSATALPELDRPASRPGQRRNRHRREIERTAEILRLQAGDVVAEIGAGRGRFSVRFAELVGPEGRVYANELDSSDVKRLRRHAEEAGLDNLLAVQGAVDDTKLPDRCCDAMMMRMVYHMLTDPEPMAESFYRALRPGGRLVILEGDPDPDADNARGVPSNRAGMGIDPRIVVDELTGVGFELERHIPDWVGSDYALLFRKPGGGH